MHFTIIVSDDQAAKLGHGINQMPADISLCPGTSKNLPRIRSGQDRHFSCKLAPTHARSKSTLADIYPCGVNLHLCTTLRASGRPTQGNHTFAPIDLGSRHRCHHVAIRECRADTNNQPTNQEDYGQSIFTRRRGVGFVKKREHANDRHHHRKDRKYQQGPCGGLVLVKELHRATVVAANGIGRGTELGA